MNRTADPGEWMIADLEGATYRSSPFSKTALILSWTSVLSRKKERKQEGRKRNEHTRRVRIRKKRSRLVESAARDACSRRRCVSTRGGEGGEGRKEGGREGIVWRDVLGYELSLPSAPSPPTHPRVTGSTHEIYISYSLFKSWLCHTAAPRRHMILYIYIHTYIHTYIHIYDNIIIHIYTIYNFS